MDKAVVSRRVRAISIAQHPIYAMLLPVPVVCFLGALMIDFVYSNSGNIMWVAFATWLILAGFVVGLVAAVVLLIDFLRDAAMRTSVGWVHFLLFYAAIVVALFDLLAHFRDGWTAVVPLGLTLSAITVVLIMVAAWLRPGREEIAP